MNDGNLYNGLINGEEKLTLIGLGYVGMPIAVENASRIVGRNIVPGSIVFYESSAISISLL